MRRGSLSKDAIIAPKRSLHHNDSGSQEVPTVATQDVQLPAPPADGSGLSSRADSQNSRASGPQTAPSIEPVAAPARPALVRASADGRPSARWRDKNRRL